jgi:hypothetical protein
MLADSEAMSVDALTYLFNMFAEGIKNRPLSPYELSLPSHICKRRRTMKPLYLVPYGQCIYQYGMALES